MPRSVSHEPLAGGGTPHGEVGPTVTVVVAGDRDVARLAPLGCVPPPDRGTARDPLPPAGGGAPHGNVFFRVAIVVARNGDVRRGTPAGGLTRPNPEPSSRRGAPNLWNGCSCIGVSQQGVALRLPHHGPGQVKRLSAGDITAAQGA